MSETLLVIHLIVILAMIVLVLLQRSEGGALGIGGGGSGNMFSSRGVGNALTKMTTVLAFAFFLTSISLTVLGSMSGRDSILDGYAPSEVDEGTAPAPLLPEIDPPAPLQDGSDIPLPPGAE